jgi:hypothetical protein
MQSAAIGTSERGVFPVGFNAYLVPDGDHPSNPPFCSPVPVGLLNIVMDLFTPELRETRSQYG